MKIACVEKKDCAGSVRATVYTGWRDCNFLGIAKYIQHCESTSQPVESFGASSKSLSRDRQTEVQSTKTNPKWKNRKTAWTIIRKNIYEKGVYWKWRCEDACFKLSNCQRRLHWHIQHRLRWIIMLRALAIANAEILWTSLNALTDGACVTRMRKR